MPEGADMDLQETPTEEEKGEELRDTMRETLKNDPTSASLSAMRMAGSRL